MLKEEELVYVLILWTWRAATNRLMANLTGTIESYSQAELSGRTVERMFCFSCNTSSDLHSVEICGLSMTELFLTRIVDKWAYHRSSPSIEL